MTGIIFIQPQHGVSTVSRNKFRNQSIFGRERRRRSGGEKIDKNTASHTDIINVIIQQTKIDFFSNRQTHVPLSSRLRLVYFPINIVLRLFIKKAEATAAAFLSSSPTSSLPQLSSKPLTDDSSHFGLLLLLHFIISSHSADSRSRH